MAKVRLTRDEVICLWIYSNRLLEEESGHIEQWETRRFEENILGEVRSDRRVQSVERKFAHAGKRSIPFTEYHLEAGEIEKMLRASTNGELWNPFKGRFRERRYQEFHAVLRRERECSE